TPVGGAVRSARGDFSRPFQFGDRSAQGSFAGDSWGLERKQRQRPRSGESPSQGKVEPSLRSLSREPGCLCPWGSAQRQLIVTAPEWFRYPPFLKEGTGEHLHRSTCKFGSR